MFFFQTINNLSMDSSKDETGPSKEPDVTKTKREIRTEDMVKLALMINE